MKGGATVFVACTVLCTWLCAWIDQSPPYFPIEISRTACGRLSRWPLFLGSVMFGYFTETRHEMLSWAGFVLLAAVTDTMSWSIHVFGVVIMMVGAIWGSWGDTAKIATLIAVCGLFLARIVAKVLVVWWAELDGHLNLSLIARTSRNIMLTGQCIRPELTLTIMKLTGMMQWGCFWAILVALS